MSDFLAALGLVFVIEGLLYAAGPSAMKKMMSEVASLPSSNIRIGGLIAMVIGVAIVWFARG